jgi:hypothetical protein
VQKSSTPSQIVENYISATGRGDTTTIRDLLSNEKFSFVGPIERFNNAEDLIKALEKLRPMITGVEIRKTFVDGPDVTCVYNLNMKAPVPEVRCTELCHVDNGKITSTEVFFDASPFREMFAKH